MCVQDLPACTTANDELVQVRGDQKTVHAALRLICKQLQSSYCAA